MRSGRITGDDMNDLDEEFLVEWHAQLDRMTLAQMFAFDALWTGRHKELLMQYCQNFFIAGKVHGMREASTIVSKTLQG
jgi:hypothetical protein